MPLYRAGIPASDAFTASGNLGLGITPTYGFHQLGGDFRLQSLATPAAPTVTINSGSGTNYYYFIVAEDRNAYVTMASPPSLVASSSLTPNNTVVWAAVAGAVKYYILRYTSNSLPDGTNTILVGTWTSGALSFLDTVAPASVTNFTKPTRNTTADMVIDGDISCIGNSTPSQTFNEVYGAGASVLGTGENVIIGAASSAYKRDVAIGRSSRASGVNGNSVCIGYNAQANTNGSIVAIGSGASAANGSIAIGASASAGSFTGSIAFGNAAVASASNQMAVGSASNAISVAYIGHGVTDTGSAAQFTLTTTGGSGTDKAGSDLAVASGVSTGAGAGGTIRLQTSPPQTTGATTNVVVDRVTIDTNGNVILSAKGAALLTTATVGFTYVPTVAGTAAGTPATLLTGTAPLVYDTTNNKLWIYNPTGTAAWKSVTLS